TTDPTTRHQPRIGEAIAAAIAAAKDQHAASQRSSFVVVARRWMNRSWHRRPSATKHGINAERPSVVKHLHVVATTKHQVATTGNVTVSRWRTLRGGGIHPTQLRSQRGGYYRKKQHRSAQRKQVQ